MDSPTIDNTQTRAICDEIGERLRTLLKSPVLEDKADLDDKLDRLSTSEATPMSNDVSTSH
jgi:hypothetical protein